VPPRDAGRFGAFTPDYLHFSVTVRLREMARSCGRCAVAASSDEDDAGADSVDDNNDEDDDDDRITSTVELALERCACS